MDSTLWNEEVGQLSCTHLLPAISLYNQPFKIAHRRGSPWAWLTLGDLKGLMK